MRPLTQLHPLALLLLLARLRLARAHSDHSFDLDDQDDAGMPYAERHVSEGWMSSIWSGSGAVTCSP